MTIKFYRPRYRIMAMQYDGKGDTLDKIRTFIAPTPVTVNFANQLVLGSDEDIICKPGEWVIKGIRGDVTVCDNKRFQDTYQEA